MSFNDTRQAFPPAPASAPSPATSAALPGFTSDLLPTGANDLPPPLGVKPLAHPPQPTAVLKDATDLFLARNGHSLQEITLFRELALNLLPATDVAVRRQIASGLALHPDTPGDVLLALAADEDAFTAFPLLHHVPDLPDDVLIAQVEKGPDGLRKTIAERPELSAAVAEALLVHSGPGVIEALMLRDDLTLSDGQIGNLLKRPDGKTGFGTMLRYKVRLSESQLMGHYLHLTPQERNQALAAAELLTLTELGRHGLTKPLRPTFKPSVLAILRDCAMAPGPELFMAELSYALRLPRPFVERMIREDDGQTLTLSLKALGFTTRDACTILIRLLGDRIAPKPFRDLVRLFGRASHGAAMLLVDRWIAAETPRDKTMERNTGVFQESLEAGQMARQQDAQPTRRQPQYQEASRPAARRAGAAPQDYPWQEIEEIENILKFG